MSVVRISKSEVQRLHSEAKAVPGIIYTDDNKYFKGTFQKRLEDITETYLLEIDQTSTAKALSDLDEELNPIARPLVQGEKNVIGENVNNLIVQGDSNIIGSSSKDIIVQGDNNVIKEGIENVTLINSSNLVISESNVTYINNQLAGGRGGDIVIITTSQSVDPLKLGYEGDTTSGEVVLELPPYVNVFEGWEQSFKKTAGKYDFVLSDSAIASITIDGETEIRLTTVNDLINIYFNGVEYKIK